MCSNHLDGQISARGRRNPEAVCEWQERINLALAWALWSASGAGITTRHASSGVIDLANGLGDAHDMTCDGCEVGGN